MMNETAENFRGEELPTWALVVVISLHTLTSLNGMVGSFLILAALIMIQHFRTTNACTYAVFMGNLVVTDIYLQTYFFPMLTVGLVMGRYPVVDTAHCVITGYLALCCYSVFLLTLTAISFDRYMRICHDKIHHKYFSWRTSLAMCAAFWAVGSVVALRGALKNSLGFDSKTMLCFIKASSDFSVSLPHLICFLFTLLASAFFNLRIYKVYYAVRRRIQNQSQSVLATSPSQKNVHPSDVALLRSIFVIIACLVFFVMPAAVARGLRSKVDIDNVVYAFLVWLISLSSSIDWIIYGLLNSRFRSGYRRILAKCNIPTCAQEVSRTSTGTKQ